MSTERIYLQYHQNAVALLDELKECLHDLPAPGDPLHPVTWRHVGLACYAASQLADLVLLLTGRPTGGGTAPYRLEFADGLMMVMDENNHGHDCFVLRTDNVAEAEAQIDDWDGRYGFGDAEVWRRELHDYLVDMAAV